MDLTWSMDEVARSTEDEAVRRRFARRNQLWLTFIVMFFTFVALIQMGDNARSRMPGESIVAALNGLFAAYSLFLMRYTVETPKGDSFLWRAGRWLRSHIHAVALVFVAIEYSVSLWLSRRGDDWSGWAFTMPFFMLGFRMLIAEHVLLHVYLAGGALLMAINTNFATTNPLPIYIGLIVVNALALGMELVLSWRLRKEVTEDWRRRRTQAREQIRMRDELRYARELQLSMIPECAPALDWVDICSVSVPATEVGGDYYDYFVDGDRIALVCGDVAGHGMASGLVLAALRSGFTLLRDSLYDPAAVLTRLHDLIAQTTRRRMLVTVSVVLLDRSNRTATIASAGHPPVLVRRANGSVETVDLWAPPLGVRLPALTIPQRRLDVATGDVFVLHSDGIYETRNAGGEAYGLDRLEYIVREHGGAAAEELRNAIISDVAAFRGTAEPDDDLTVVVCRLV
jgi:hypothetical protein